MPGPNTIFTPLWVDRPDAEDELRRRILCGELSEQLGEQLSQLITQGFVILPNAISGELADAMVDEILNVVDHPKYYIARRKRKAYAHPSREIYNDPTFRLIDYHVNSSLARETIFCAAVTNVLQACFDDALNAFQCLTFNYGSQQWMHQDGAYVVVSEPLQFMASWIALEDVSPGSGELQYHPGSHKLDDFLFPHNSKNWNPVIHGREIHREFLEGLKQLRSSSEMPLTQFRPNKGDALIWASDLVHGGADILNDRTRRSVVTHYCPLQVKPNFKTFSGHYWERQERADCYYSSRHYKLKPGPIQRLLPKYDKQNKKKKPVFMGQKSKAQTAAANKAPP